MDRKKILYIITKGSPYGGAQKYVYDLVTKLPKDKSESAVLVGAGDELPHKLEKSQIRVLRLPELMRDINIVSEWKVFWQLVKILKSEKPDIVHLNSSKIGGLGALAVRFVNVLSSLKIKNSKLKICAVFTAHGWAFNEKRNSLSILIIRFLSWLTIMLCHKVIVVAKNEEARALNMPFTRKKIELVYNGLEPIDFKNKNEAREFLSEKIKTAMSRAVLDTPSIWIGTIAELHKNKNLPSLIDVMREIKESAILLIIGEGEERKNLEQTIEKNNLQDKVFLVGRIENAGILLKAFDIFVLPSVKEGLPYTLLEAGLAELPCLSTYVGGIPEIIRNNVSGILVEPTTNKIREGLEFLITHPDKAKEFGKALHEKIQKDFSLEKMIEETIKVYEK